jgi:hypothetical protein
LVDEFNRKNGIKFTYTRIPSEDKSLKRTMFETNFYYAETSFKMLKKDVHTTDFLEKMKIELDIEKAGTEDYNKIKDLVYHSFQYSRFHEDINIEPEKARLRLCYWIDDLVAQNKDIYISKLKNEIIGLHVQKAEKNKADMILTGTKKDRTLISLPFWGSVFEMNKRLGIRELSSLISASNIGVVNLYSYFGFKFEETLLGYHKFYTDIS